MKLDKLKVYFLEIQLIIILFFALFASRIFTRWVVAIILAIYAAISLLMLKKKKIQSIFNKQVTFLMLLFSGIYLTVFYALGLYFGFTKAKFRFSLFTISRFIIPFTIIIIASEIIRKVLLHQEIKLSIKGRKIDLSSAFVYLIMVLIDLVIYTGVYDLTTLDNFMVAVGFVLFASISCNLLYNYISIRFGDKPIIIFRLITVLSLYIIPVTPDVYLFFRSFLRMIYPYLIYLVLENTYSKSNFAIAYKDKKKRFMETTILFIFITLIVMLVSCKFTYGILVIGSRSMTGTIDVGDAAVFKSYTNQKIKVGDILVFNKLGTTTVHRVVEIRKSNDQYRYYTRGDANAKDDDGYITNENIIGIVKFKIHYIGYPTLLVRQMFEK